jgi:large subunit ribosomal protein L10
VEAFLIYKKEEKMASAKILESKKKTVDEIVDKIKNSESVILFQYQGLTVAEMTELRKKLREVTSEVKVYKNTLLKKAMNELNINIDEFLDGPNAVLFGESLLEPIKVISDFAKDHKKLDVRVGVISGKVADKKVVAEYAAIPSREGLLTMLAGGMIQYVRDLAIGLNLYAEKLEGKEN